ncbi:MAG: hypothetical protein ACKVXR_15300 [Planctomycetota bacterium]
MFAILVVLVLFGAVACDEAQDPATARAHDRAYPPGTVLVVNDVPIRAEEVDSVGSNYALLEPQDSLLQLRRLALATTILPTIAAQGIDPEARTRARELAQSYRAALLAGELPPGPLAGPMEVERTGQFTDLGFLLWRNVLPLQPGAWSEIFESPGSFHLARVKSREEGSLPSLTRFTIGLFHFPYLKAETAHADTEAAIDGSHLSILDEAWRDAVPAKLRYRMNAENP